VKTGYCDVMVTSLDEALRILKNAVRKGEATSLDCGKLRDLIPELAKRGVVPDLADGSDQRARSYRRVRAEWNDAGSGAGAAEEES